MEWKRDSSRNQKIFEDEIMDSFLALPRYYIYGDTVPGIEPLIIIGRSSSSSNELAAGWLRQVLEGLQPEQEHPASQRQTPDAET